MPKTATKRTNVIALPAHTADDAVIARALMKALDEAEPLSDSPARAREADEYRRLLVTQYGHLAGDYLKGKAFDRECARYEAETEILRKAAYILNRRADESYPLDRVLPF